MAKQTLEVINALRIRANAAGLDGLDFLATYTDEQIADAYNGIGPAFLADDARDKLSLYLNLFAPAALIHDLRYTVSDGTRSSFNVANFEFRGNCYLLAEKRYGVLNWRRYRAYFVAETLFAAVASQAGWIAWTGAHRRRSTNH